LFFTLALLLEEYGVTFEYLPEKKHAVVEALSRLEIDELKIHKEESLTLLLESERSNIKLSMYRICFITPGLRIRKYYRESIEKIILN
jgi:hypothetical protein